MAKAPQKLGPASRIRRNVAIPTGRVDDELMALDPKAGEVLALDPIGTMVWERIGEETTIDALIASIIADHDVTREQCLADLLPFLEQCRDAGLIIVGE